jgi:hypothetical protein
MVLIAGKKWSAKVSRMDPMRGWRPMTSSAFAWLDYSDGERRRMLEVIDLFREKGTLDELGTELRGRGMQKNW